MRPFPPEICIGEYIGIDYFISSPELNDWVRKTFLDDKSLLHNPDHAHLLDANIGYLWTNVPCSMKQRGVAGMAEYPFFRSNPWINHRQMMQITDWFGEIPDFIITLDANYCLNASDIDFCALVEHELYHCAQKLNEYGEPMFNPMTERPIFCMRGHDVEEFVGVVRRYGIGSTANGREFVAAAVAEPEIAQADVSMLCGNCLR